MKMRKDMRCTSIPLCSRYFDLTVHRGNIGDNMLDTIVERYSRDEHKLYKCHKDPCFIMML